MKACIGFSFVAALAALYACTGDDPVVASPGGNDAGTSSEDAAVVPALTVTAAPRVFVPTNVAVDVVITIARTGFDGPVKVEFDKLPASVLADGAPTIAAGATTATIRLSTASTVQAFSRAKLTATVEGANPITVSTDVEVTLRGRSGEADTTFGVNGTIDLSSSDKVESIYDAAADNAGRIYLLLPDLLDNTKCRVFRTTPNGAIDASGWGTNGIVEFRRPGNAAMYCGRLALQADGKVLVGGHDYGTPDVAWIARLVGTPGSANFLDGTYGTAGFTLVNGVAVYSITVDTSDRALVYGGTGSSNYLRRVSTAGVLDNGFATPSSVLDTLSPALAPTANGAIYGACQGGEQIFRVSESGALDTSLGTGGFLRAPKPVGSVESEVNNFRRDSKGRIVGIGKTDTSPTVSGVVVRVDGNTFDPTFGPGRDGLAFVTGSFDLQYVTLAIDEADGIIAAWTEYRSGTDIRVGLTRFVDGVVDSAFSPSGLRALPNIGTINDVRGMVLQEQRVLVLLFAEVAGKSHPLLVRLWR